MNVRRYAAAALLLAGASLAAQAETFRCSLGDRVVSYQQTPCAVPDLRRPPPAAPGSTVRPAPAAAFPVLRPAPPASAPRARPAATGLWAFPPPAPGRPAAKTYTKLTPRDREVLDLTTRFERCRADQPGFAEKTSELYRAWQRRHASTLAEHTQWLGLKLRVARPADAAACSDDWLRQMEPLARDPDPRFATPEKTWGVFVRALGAADRARILDCVTPAAARALVERLAKMADTDLRRMAAAVRAMKVQWGDDYEREGLVVQADRIDAIVFRRNVNEEWKIGALWASPDRPMPRRSSPDS